MSRPPQGSKWHVGGGRMIEQSLPDGGMMASLIVFVSLVGLTGLLVGAWLGSWWEERAARRDAAEDQAAAEAAMFVEELREPDEVTLRREAMARRTRPVYRQPRPDPLAIQMRPPRRRRTSTAAFLNTPSENDPYNIRAFPTVPPEVAHEELAPPGYAAAEFDVDAIIAGFHADADQIVEWARVAGEHWAGQ